jgi:ribonuclease HI
LVPGAQALSFADSVAWMVTGKNVTDITEQLEKCAAESIVWAQRNAVAFDSAKTEALLLTRKTRLPRMQVRVDGHRIPYNKEATRWLGVWLDSQLLLTHHHRIRLAKAKQAEARVRSLVGKFGLTPANVRRVQVAAVQAVALYGAELWWDGQKGRRDDIHLMVNRQARAITGALPPTALGPLIKESGLRSAESLLNNRTRRFGSRQLATPSRGPDGETIINPTSEMVRQSPIVVTKPLFPKDDPRWQLAGHNRKRDLATLWKGPKTLADRLWDAATNPVREDIPEADNDSRLRSPVMVEATRMLWTRSSLKGRVIMEDTESAKATAETWTADRGIAIFTDGSKFEDGCTGCAAVWKSGDGWQGRKVFMGRNKEVFDAELYAIWIGLASARDHLKDDWMGAKSITFFTDAQAALKRIRNDDPGPGQWLARRIIRTERQLRQAGWTTEFRWVPGHKGVEGNEVADQWAKEGAEATGAEHLPREEESITTLAHVARGITEAKWNEHLAWVKERCRGKRYYLLRERQHTDPVASRAQKATASRFYQFRMNKAPTGPYLAEVGQAADDKKNAGGAPGRHKPGNTFSSIAAGGKTSKPPCGGLLAGQQAESA